MVEALHRVIAYLSGGAVALGVVWALVLAVQRRSGGRAFEAFQAAVVSALIIGAASGGILLAAGRWAC